MSLIETAIAEQQATETCPICGETSPGAKWICLYRLDPAARKSVAEQKSCEYSLEGHARLSASLERVGEKIAATRSS
jgi:hypothetical protein